MVTGECRELTASLTLPRSQLQEHLPGAPVQLGLLGDLLLSAVASVAMLRRLQEFPEADGAGMFQLRGNNCTPAFTNPTQTCTHPEPAILFLTGS